MTTKETTVEIIAEDLANQILLCHDSLKESARMMAMLKTDAREYKQAWESIASAGAMLMQFKTLESCIQNKDERMVENFLRYTVHRILQVEGEPGTDTVTNGMHSVLATFSYYLTYFEQ